MHRQTVYPGQILPETTLLNLAKDSMIGMAKLTSAVLGTSTVVNGLSCTPTAPASMQVQISPGEIYSLQNIDNSAYSSLPADTVHQIVKQGLLMDALTLTCTAPVAAGQAINYLVQAAYQDVDATPVTLPYYNASNPLQAFSGQNNNGVAQATVRQGLCTVSLKPGVAANSGTQLTPAPDLGNVGLYVVTVINGQTSISASSISQYPSAPILPASLAALIQNNALGYGVDVGVVNSLQANYPAPPKFLVDNQPFWVNVKYANTGAATFTPNPGVIAASPVVGAAHSPLQGGELVAGGRAQLIWRADISSYVLIECTGGAAQVAPATQSNHAVNLGQFGALLAPNGYLILPTNQKLPNPVNLILQWGTGTFAADSTTTVNLPIAFPNAFIGVVTTVRDNVATGSALAFGAAVPLNLSSFSMRAYYTASVIRHTWFALGY